ncbi:NAD(P)-binding protein [Pleomassaria siparia CBS 279.74]|uniref:NAD(P)-binding protein n=1 Tax=Pleomassaria siparia CBS 279.74 TaxID=1314801 RepID=A0A6G1K9Y2_9PLEO|nr:NAD(P)-binding protein [Pleomassaria siparia CBS 279.74]
MVNIAVAGGTGNVATEILRATIANLSNNITIFTRGTPPSTSSPPNVTYKTVDYTDKASLISNLQGIEVCLSFLVVHFDKDCTVQKNLIHACIEAGVRRFSPSEWGIKNGSGVPPYDNKDAIAKYLYDLNKDKPVLEYSLFQPSIFLDYFAHPYPLSPNLITWPFFLDFENRRAMIFDSGDQPLVFTSISDISKLLALAIADSRTWPPIGGMIGTKTSINELLALGKKIRGDEWTEVHISSEDIKKGELNSSWVPQISHPVIPEESREAYSKEFLITFFEAMSRGSWEVSGEWNERFPDFEWQSAEGYLKQAWEGRE